MEVASLGFMQGMADHKAAVAQRLREMLTVSAHGPDEMAVAGYEMAMEALTSVHKYGSWTIDWAALLSWAAGRCVAPVRQDSCEIAARAALEDYAPGWFARTIGIAAHTRRRLELEVEKARLADEAVYTKALAAFEDATASKELIERVIARDAEALNQVIEAVDPVLAFFTGDGGARWDTTAISPNAVEVAFTIDGSKIVPPEVVRMGKRGRALRKAMPKRDYHAAYQDYVCGVALRGAQDVLAFLPVDVALISVRSRVLDESTGHDAERLIFSGIFPHETMQGLRLDRVDASDCITKNFKHNMTFKKLSGFEPVDEITI